MNVVVDGVGKRFGRVVALDGVSFQLPAASRVALIGPNGSGKSTLTRILMGMLAATGEVRIGGLSPFADRERLADRLGYVPQEAPSFSVPVGDLVRAVTSVRRIDIATVVARAAELDLDYDDLRRRPFRTLSGGMKQKLLIALALASEPELLLLDEPTAALDAAARARFFARLEALPASTTIVLCSHRLEELQHLVDRVVVLDEGRLVEEGEIGRFLARRAQCAIELRTTRSDRSLWLREHGFVASASGWWVATVPRAEKEALVRQVVTRFVGELDELVVRDVDSVEPAAAPEPGRAADAA